MMNSAPAFGAGVKVAPSKPAKDTVPSTAGFFSASTCTCRAIASVRSSEVPGGIRLTAPGLVARAFGSRRRDRDPRLAAFLGGVR